jgi:hypothetical protein
MDLSFINICHIVYLRKKSRIIIKEVKTLLNYFIYLFIDNINFKLRNEFIFQLGQAIVIWPIATHISNIEFVDTIISSFVKFIFFLYDITTIVYELCL